MESLNQWWGSLQSLNQWFYMAAAFFSVVLLWQLIAAVLGLGSGDHSFDTHAEPTWDHQTPHDAQATVNAFKLLSIRSILSFLTLFTWAGALYMNNGVAVAPALAYALIWGLAAMVLISLIFYLMRRMSETGSMQIGTTVGIAGTVYLDIAVGGVGEVRVTCSGVMTHLKARLASGGGAKAGTPIRVVKVLGPNTVEVEVDATQERKG